MKLNDRYEVLTPKGWRDFKGVQQKGEKETYELVFSDGTSVRATPNHIFYNKHNEKVEVKDLSVGDEINTVDGLVTLSRKQLYGKEVVYDLVEVIDSDHQFIVQSKIFTKNCDEFAFVRPSMATEFWTAIQPVLSTGGSCIITSTPKNDEDMFAQIWKGANDNTDEYGNTLPGGVGVNGFFPILVKWNEHPERDEKWAAPFRQSLGPARFAQEMECEFVSDDETLIDPMALVRLKHQEPEFFTGQIRWYKEPEPNKTYLVGLDPCLGTGGDYSAIEVFEIPGMIQVAEWQHNKTPPRQQVKMLMNILQMLDAELRDHPDQNGEPTIYWTVENNTLGETALQVIEDTGEHLFPGTFISEKKKVGSTRRYRKGLNTDHRKKLAACAKFKSLLESDRMAIRSHGLIKQLKNFVASGGSYAAKSGEKDDLVMASMLIVRMLETVVNWMGQDEADELRDSIDPDDVFDEPMPVIIG